MMSSKKFLELSKQWQLDDAAGVMVFSDHLLEIGETEWANMMRWVQESRKLGWGATPVKEWIEAAVARNYIEEGGYHIWLRHAKYQKYPVIES